MEFMVLFNEIVNKSRMNAPRRSMPMGGDDGDFSEGAGDLL